MDPKSGRDRAIEKLGELIDRIQIAMLTTVTEDGRLWSRPIATQHAAFDGDLWLLSKLDSPKAQEVRQHRQVSLSYAKLDENIYVSLSGTAEIVTDRAKAHELWNPSYAEWLPGGPDDPDLALIRVSVERAEYWDAPKLTWRTVAGFVVLSHEHFDDPDFHARITLNKSSAEDS